MTQEEIIEGNKLIDMFMGGNCAHMNESTFWIYDLCYHQSWNLLMPVVENIKDIALTELVYKKHISEIDVLNLYITAPINTIWEQVIYFIHWYNTQSQSSNKTN